MMFRFIRQILKAYPELNNEAVRLKLLETHEKYDPGEYWRFNERNSFLRIFLETARDWIVQNLKTDSRIVDLCGGCGTLGLALAMDGYYNYCLIDISESYLKWGKDLYSYFGLELESYQRDVLKFENKGLGPATDAVCLLGHENAEIPYECIIDAASSCLKPGGFLLFTYQDDEEWRNGKWDEVMKGYYPQWNRGTFPLEGCYLITYEGLKDLLKQRGLQIISRVKTSERKDSSGNDYPQYFVVTYYG